VKLFALLNWFCTQHEILLILIPNLIFLKERFFWRPISTLETLEQNPKAMEQNIENVFYKQV